MSEKLFILCAVPTVCWLVWSWCREHGYSVANGGLMLILLALICALASWAVVGSWVVIVVVLVLAASAAAVMALTPGVGAND